LGKTIRNYDGDGMRVIKKQKPKKNRNFKVDDFYDDDFYDDDTNFHQNDNDSLQYNE